MLQPPRRHIYLTVRYKLNSHPISIYRWNAIELSPAPNILDLKVLGSSNLNLPSRGSNSQREGAPPANTTSPADSHSPSAGQARARTTLRKSTTPKYRTRNMIIVYYDSYVQTLFKELVKFVNAGRNMTRKLAAEMMDDDDEQDNAAPTADGLIEVASAP